MCNDSARLVPHLNVKPAVSHLWHAIIITALSVAGCTESTDYGITIRSASAINGGADVLLSPSIDIYGGRIRRVSAQAQAEPLGCVIDLGDYTILPGLIDTHVHINATFADGLSPEQQGRANALSLLESGFTTVRTLDGPGVLDIELRDSIAKGTVPGPRLLASGEPMTEEIVPTSADAAAVRDFVNKTVRHSDWFMLTH